MTFLATGLGLAIGWLWLTFLNGPLVHGLAAEAPRPQQLMLAFLLAHSLAYLGVARVGASGIAPRRILSWCLAGAALMAAAPFALLFPPPHPLAAACWLTLAALLTAPAAALLIAAWGTVYSGSTPDKTAPAFGLAIVISTAVLLVGSAVPPALAGILAAACPLLSVALLAVRPGGVGGPPAREQEFRSPIPLKLVLLLGLFYTVGGFMHKMVNLRAPTGQEVFWVTNAVYCGVALVAGAYIRFFPDADLRLLYRPVVPLVFAGFLLFPFLKPGSSLPFVLLQAGFALLDLYTWVLFVYFGSRSRSPLHAIGWGMFFLTLALTAGDLALTAILPLLALSAHKVTVTSFAAAGVILAASFILQDEPETFAGWSYDGGDVSPAGPADALSPVPPPPFLAVAADTGEKVALLLKEAQLTPRENDVFEQLLRGRNNPYIRKELNISDNTLKTHLRSIYRKLDVANRQELLDRIDAISGGG
ncbi:response regulator transcription factor [Anaeroselena agilis]|uniref:Helix-turn-helix transcriptional regulator n=1 Tax=Anaeroselena agilis TaxID=3063788 RepID=A0ABU3P276_9FIRM|nr:helix-turn-helix transcriptional regulator [Selenomonadales bacterium 4137-cl]